MIPNVISESLKRSPSYRQFLLEEQAAEQKKVEAIAAAANSELQKTSQAYADLQKSFWSKPLADIAKVMSSGSASLISTCYWNCLLTTEFNADEEQIHMSGTPAEAESTLKQWLETLPSRLGVTLNQNGRLRFTFFVQSQILTGKNFPSIENCDIFLKVLIKYSCFDAAAGECSYDERRITKRPEPVKPEPTVDDLLKIDSSTDQGKIAAWRLADELGSIESRPVAQAWLASLQQNFAGFQPTDDDLAYSVRWFQSNNKSPLSPVSYDQFRLHMVRIGRWPTTLLTVEDVRERCIEVLPVDSDRELRRKVFNSSRQVLVDLLASYGKSLV